jgi:hypothetical protein
MAKEKKAKVLMAKPGVEGLRFGLEDFPRFRHAYCIVHITPWDWPTF